MTSDFFKSRADECLEMAENSENLTFVKQVLNVAEIFRSLSKLDESEKNSEDFLECVEESEKLFFFCKKLANILEKNGYFFG